MINKMSSSMNMQECVSYYVVPYDDVKNITSEKFEEFEKKSEELLVILKLTHSNVDWNIEHIIENCAVDNLENTMLYRKLKSKDYRELEEKLDDLYSCLVTDKDSVLSVFKEKTGMTLVLEYNCEQGVPFFALLDEEVVELTPKAKKLKELGCAFNLESWV